MEVITSVLGGVVIAVISGVTGKALNSKDSVDCHQCTERRMSCQALLTEKIDSGHSLLTQKLDTVTDKVDILTKAVNSKIFGIM